METTGHLSNAGLSLFYRAWRPATPPRAVVAIIPGFNSHSGYYGWVAERLTARGLAVSAVDLRGRGRSDGERFYVDSFDDYVSDAHALVTHARARDPGLPLFLLGHSAGGVVAALYAAAHQRELAGFVCESFAFKVPAPDFALAVFKGLAHVAPHAHILRLKNEEFSRDPEAVRRMNEDPLIAHEAQPTRTLAAMVRADEQLERAFPAMTLPLLILHGTRDKATAFQGSEQFQTQAGSKDKTLRLYDGGYHDLLNDTIRETVLTDIEGWLAAHLGAP
jgi:alpha-beta hydrolase superfamily lysophospholipase